jgi:hypothetical protein
MNHPFYHTILKTLKECHENYPINSIVNEKEIKDFNYHEGYYRIRYEEGYINMPVETVDRWLITDTQSAARSYTVHLLNTIDYSNPRIIDLPSLKSIIQQSGNRYWMTNIFVDSDDNIVLRENELSELESFGNVLIDGRHYFLNKDLRNYIPDNIVIELLEGNQVITDFYGFRFGTSIDEEFGHCDYLEILAITYFSKPENIKVYEVTYKRR